MKIPNPRYATSGYNAWFAAFALVFVCFPLLNATLAGAVAPQESKRIQVFAWIMVALLLWAAKFLVVEFIFQFRHWLRKRAGKNSVNQMQPWELLDLTNPRPYKLTKKSNRVPGSD